jgi:enamine deaminase RidA (YjgF/YER057c/UK114 family)
VSITRETQGEVCAAGAGTDLVLLTWSAGATTVASEHELVEAYRALDGALQDLGAVPIQERVFTEGWMAGAVASARARALARSAERWAVPPTLVEGAPVAGAGVAGIHVFASRGRSRILAERGRSLGRIVDGASARYVGLSDVGRRLLAPRVARQGLEARAVLEAADALLAGEGLSFTDVARTWFYLDGILDWYGDFNGARNAFFRGAGLASDGRNPIPASTGIGGRNARGGCCALDLVAIQAAGPGCLDKRRLHNPRQNEATQYGSAFSRALEVTTSDARYVFVSGTAAIDGRGASLHADDFEAQALYTLDAVEALLDGAGAQLADIGQATAFLKRRCDAAAFARLAGRRGIESVPVVTALADVCRPELLFELDATVVLPRTPPVRR